MRPSRAPWLPVRRIETGVTRWLVLGGWFGSWALFAFVIVSVGVIVHDLSEQEAVGDADVLRACLQDLLRGEQTGVDIGLRIAVSQLVEQDGEARHAIVEGAPHAIGIDRPGRHAALGDGIDELDPDLHRLADPVAHVGAHERGRAQASKHDPRICKRLIPGIKVVEAAATEQSP